MIVATASTKAFDSEFAFYGPVGFDIGQLWANLLMAAARSAALGDSDNLAWRLAQPAVVWEAFERSAREPTGPSASTPPSSPTGSSIDSSTRVRADALDAAAAEAARRVIGPYPVSDIETLDPEPRVVAVRSIPGGRPIPAARRRARRGEPSCHLRSGRATC